MANQAEKIDMQEENTKKVIDGMYLLPAIEWGGHTSLFDSVIRRKRLTKQTHAGSPPLFSC